MKKQEQETKQSPFGAKLYDGTHTTLPGKLHGNIIAVHVWGKQEGRWYGVCTPTEVHLRVFHFYTFLFGLKFLIMYAC